MFQVCSALQCFLALLQALQWVTLGSIVAYLGYNTGGMFVTGETPFPVSTANLRRYSVVLQDVVLRVGVSAS